MDDYILVQEPNFTVWQPCKAFICPTAHFTNAATLQDRRVWRATIDERLTHAMASPGT